MRKWFRTNKEVAEQNRSFRDLTVKLELLERTLQSVQRPSEYHIHIESLTVDKPVLEQLVFRLDSLDIQEISGSLNLGNNFGTANGLRLKEQKPKQVKPGEKKAPGAGPEIVATPSGYSLKI
ncbi:MAG TPA: hypothetical protein VF260_12145 [Bacilli bacterium]